MTQRRSAGDEPNPITQPTQRPTFRWVFQLLAGMHRVRVTAQGQVQTSWKSVLMCRSPSCTCAEMRSIDSRTCLPGRAAQERLVILILLIPHLIADCKCQALG